MSFLDDSQTPNAFGWACQFVLGKPAGCHAHSGHLPSTSPSPPLPAMHPPCTRPAPALHLPSTRCPPTVHPPSQPPSNRPATTLQVSRESRLCHLLSQPPCN